MEFHSSKPRRRYSSRIAITRAEERKLRRLDIRFREIFDKVPDDPFEAVKQTGVELRRNLMAFLKAEGESVPKKCNLFELWTLARAGFGEPARFYPEFSIGGRIAALLLVIEAVVVNELEHLPNNGFHIEGVGKPDTLMMFDARLIVMLGHVAVNLIITVWAINEDDRLLGVDRRQGVNGHGSTKVRSQLDVGTRADRKSVGWLTDMLAYVSERQKGIRSRDDGRDF